MSFWVQDADANAVFVAQVIVSNEPPYEAAFLVFENDEWQWLPADKFIPPPAPQFAQERKRSPCGCEKEPVNITSGAIARQNKERWMCPDCGHEWLI